MALSHEPYKGTRDFYPKDMQFRNWMFGKLSGVVRSYGYQEYGGPMLESFDLYAAKSGEEIVNNQLYWLIDKGERKLAVRPEMTPTLARMVAAKIHELPRPIRLFSIPNLWRYERPQRGRLREHWQLNVDVLGGDPLQADSEVLMMAKDLIRTFGGAEHMVIRVNHRSLMNEFFLVRLGLTVEQAAKVVKAIDAKDKVDHEKFLGWLRDAGVREEQVSTLLDFFKSDLSLLEKTMPCEGVTYLSRLLTLLDDAGVEGVVFDPTIMRGLDYYTGTVFEMYDQSPDNRRAMFGGGRYDNLVGLFGKDSISGVGFGMGDASLQNFLETHGLVPKLPSDLDVFVTLPSDQYLVPAQKLCASLRAMGLRVTTPLQVGSFGSQLKQATRLEARYAILFGDAEWANGQVLVKHLETGRQDTVGVDGLQLKMFKN